MRRRPGGEILGRHHLHLQAAAGHVIAVAKVGGHSEIPGQVEDPVDEGGR